MAITHLQYPNIISPSYNPMFYMDSSDHSSDTGFRYEYILHDENGVIATKRVIPFPNDYGRIDVSNILKSFLSFDLSYNSTGITDSTQCIKEYDTYIGHVFPTFTPVSSGIKFTFNGVSNDDFTYTDYILGSSSSKFLTASPTMIDVFLTDYYTLGFFNGVFGASTSSCKYIYVKVYSGTTNQTYRLTNPDYQFSPGGTLVNVDKMIKQVGVGPTNLNASTMYNLGTSSNQTGGFIDSNTIKYEVWSADLSTTQTSVVFTFTMNKYPTRYGKFQLAFLNRLGQFSYYTFYGKTLETTKVDNNTFLKNRYYLNGTNWTTDISSRGTDTYNTNTSTEYTFQSDYVEQGTMDFMEQLFTSPQIFYLTQLGAVPLVMLDTDWSNKKKVNDKTIGFSVKCGLSNKKKINI